MPNPTDRPSLTKTIEQRYAEQHVGGAFDAKAITLGGKHSPIDNSTLSALHTTPGFKTQMGEQETELNEAKGQSSLESSLMMKGFNNIRYGDSVNAKGK
jgi:hypothetical protein